MNLTLIGARFSCLNMPGFKGVESKDFIGLHVALLDFKITANNWIVVSDWALVPEFISTMPFYSWQCPVQVEQDRSILVGPSKKTPKKDYMAIWGQVVEKSDVVTSPSTCYFLLTLQHTDSINVTIMCTSKTNSGLEYDRLRLLHDTLRIFDTYTFSHLQGTT